MKEKLIIKNFGPIKSVELELSRFNVLIGEQATGKSTVAKVLAMCRYYYYIIDEVADKNSENTNFSNGFSDWGLEGFVQDGTYIRYDCQNYIFSFNSRLSSEKDGYRVKDYLSHHQSLQPSSTAFETLLDFFKENVPLNKEDAIAEVGTSWTTPRIAKLNLQNAIGTPFFIPTERGLQSIFSLGKSSIQNFTDSLFTQLAQLDQIARGFRSEIEIEPLKIIYKNEDGNGLIRKDGGHDFISLHYAARGYQSTIPVVLVIERYAEREQSNLFIIEEPEMNLFPGTQQKLIQYLVSMMNLAGHSMMITTHSPYILTSLNNLIYAYIVGKSNPKKVEEIIDFKSWLNQEDVSAYMMLPDGTCESIMDEELKQLKVEDIDSISEKLSEQWHMLADME